MYELRTVGQCSGSEVKKMIQILFLAQTDHLISLDLNVSSQAAEFNWVLSVYVFLSLKTVSPIDCHYTTDRQFELKISVCVLLKKLSQLHLGCPGGKQINIRISFLGELSL